MNIDVAVLPNNKRSKVKCCDYCSAEIIGGRADRKFCNDTCRGYFNNQLNCAANNKIRNINRALGRNWRALKSLLPPEETSIKVSKNKLIELGYNFKYSTHQFINPSGKVYTYSYDLGYLLLENEVCLIVRAKD